MKNYIKNLITDLRINFFYKKKLTEKYDICCHKHFLPINKRLIKFPSVFGIFPRNSNIVSEIKEWQEFIKNEICIYNKRKPFQEINHTGQLWEKNKNLIHKHEIHLRLDENLANNVKIL